VPSPGNVTGLAVVVQFTPSVLVAIRDELTEMVTNRPLPHPTPTVLVPNPEIVTCVQVTASGLVYIPSLVAAAYRLSEEEYAIALTSMLVPGKLRKFQVVPLVLE
jgi:hypothetical protein